MRLISRYWSTIVATLIAVLALWLALRNVDAEKVLAGFTRLNLVTVGAGILLYSAILVARSERWYLLLGGAKAVSRMRVFWLTSIGYLANNFLPFRAGDILRSAALSRGGTTTFTFAFATTIVDRVIDLAVVSALVLGGGLLAHEDLPKWALLGATGLIVLIVIIGCIATLAITHSESKIRKFAVRITDDSPRVQQVLQGFAAGLRSSASSESRLRIGTTTILIWALECSVPILVAVGLGESLSIGGSMLLIGGLGVASCLPTTPGNLGVFQLVAVGILPIVGIAAENALVLILVCQGMLYVATCIWGGLGMLVTGVSFRDRAEN